MGKRKDKKPNFFIVGAARTGTTSMWMYLKQHPEIFMPDSIEHKEPSFYCQSYGVSDINAFYQLFSTVKNEKAIGEASTPYLTSPESAVWIYNELPEAKIIIALRNPVDRAYSMYRWMVSHGYEWVYPFEKALELEAERRNNSEFFAHNPQYFYNYMYYESGLYSVQLERYFSVFPAKQIKIVVLDEFKKKPLQTIQGVYDFLGVAGDFVPTIKVHNSANLRPAFVDFHFRLRRIQQRFRHTRRGHLAEMLAKKNLTLLNLEWPELNSGTKQKLSRGYREDILKTQGMIERDLSFWLT